MSEGPVAPQLPNEQVDAPEAEGERQAMRERLEGLRDLVGRRDALVRRSREGRAGKERPAVSFRPARPVSTANADLSSLEKRLARPSSPRELESVERAIAEIERKMNDDIALLKRLERSRALQ